MWKAEHSVETTAQPEDVWKLWEPAADSLGPQLGPQISADFPQTLSALVACAEA
jgi:hypothetical protein